MPEITRDKISRHAKSLICCSAAALLLGWNGPHEEKARCTARRIVGIGHRFLGCHLDYDGRGKETIRSSVDEARCDRSCEKVGPQLSVGKAAADCVSAPIQDVNGFGSYLGCYLQAGGKEMVQTPDVISEVECATLCS